MSASLKQSRNPRGSSEKSKSEAELAGSEPGGMRRHLMQRGITGVTASRAPGGVDRSRHIFGLDRSRRRLQSETVSSPYKAYVSYPFESARTSSKKSSASTTTSDESATTTTTKHSKNSSKSKDKTKTKSKSKSKSSDSDSDSDSKKSSRKGGKSKHGKL